MKINHKLLIVVGIFAYVATFGWTTAQAQNATGTRPTLTTPPAGYRAQNQMLMKDNMMIRQDNMGIRREFQDDKRAEVEAIQRDKADFRAGLTNASGTPEDRRLMMKDAKGTLMAERMAAKEKIKTMRQDAFTFIRDNLSKELDNVTKILDNAYKRLSDYITKASTEGKDMTEAKALLAKADAAIKKAKADILAFKNFKLEYTPVKAFVGKAEDAGGTKGNSIPQGAEVDIVKPRTLAMAARISIEEARKALRAVAINLGFANPNAGNSNGQGIPNGGNSLNRPGVRPGTGGGIPALNTAVSPTAPAATLPVPPTDSSNTQ